jgi:hypothetical protein
MLDLTNPACTRGRMIDRGSKLRLDELKRHASDLAEAEEIASPPMTRLSGKGWKLLA